MDKMFELEKTSIYVKKVLEEKPFTRNSDDALYTEVCRSINPHVVNVSMVEFLNRRKELGCPPFETVRRTRQKMQAEHPELKAANEVYDERKRNEVIFERYART